MKIKQFADRLYNARINHQVIAPISNEIGFEDIDLAYKIQEYNIERRVVAGSRIIGKKIGLTSRSVQKQFDIDQPDFGVLFQDMEILTGGCISVSKLFNPRVEAEIAFILGDDLDMEHMTIIDMMNAIDCILPSIELVDSRIQNWEIKITDTIADNASASHYILGHTPKTLDEVDIIKCEMALLKNGKVESSGKGADCLGSPLNALYWLAHKMFDLGTPLEEGDLILSGALGPMINVGAGDEMVANFSGLGSVSVNFID